MNLLLLYLLSTVVCLYENTPSILSLTTKNFDTILTSNQTSIVEFYAPWCGHCQQLAPEMIKASKLLQDIALVGAVNCDENINKELCSKYRVQGYPTIMAFRPPKWNVDEPEKDLNEGYRRYAHATETFQGARKSKSLVEFAVARIKNYVKRLVTLVKLDEWLNKQRGNGRIKMIVVTPRERLSALLKSVAIDLLGIVDVAYMPIKANTIAAVSEKFGIEGDKATLVIYKDGDYENFVKYDEDLSKDGILKFVNKYVDVEEVISRVEYLRDFNNNEKKKKKEKKSKKKSKKNGEKKKFDDEL